MAVSKYLLSGLLALCLLAACKQKKKPSLSGEDPVEVSDFIRFFEPVKLPFVYADTSLAKKEKDSLLISYKVFTQFVPDTLLAKVFGKGVKPKIYSLGKTEVPKGESYLFVKTVAGDKRAVFIVAFDSKEKYINGVAVLRPDKLNTTSQSVSLDKRFTITKTVQRRNTDGSQSEGKDVYILNADSRNFMLIMTDALDEKVTELINPIDTLPRKNKLSADYGPGKMTLVSIRDGRKPDRLSFFIHFEKNNGECTGELKGEAMIKSPNTAEYRENGDPCILQFNFSSASVTLKETNCGSRRGLNCTFDGNFGRRKWVKPAAPKTEKPTPPRKPVKK
ncbi:MAG: hypothetical protein NTW29_10935 [Bacteroidetes bacterium]|nr:hypothetical protein [Bacteroidota bacterium]